MQKRETTYGRYRIISIQSLAVDEFAKRERALGRLPIFLLGAAGLLLMPGQAWAQDATWIGATSSDWYTGSNWSTGSVPTGIATFTNNAAPTTITTIGNGSIDTIRFTALAPAFLFTGVGFNGGINGIGIANNSTNAVSFIFNGGVTSFDNASTAGNATITLNDGSLYFKNNSTAGTSVITNNGATSTIQFQNNSTADNSNITNNGRLFVFSTTAGNSAIVNNSRFDLFDTATAGSATITTNNGGTTTFRPSYGGGPPANSTAGQARLIVNSGGVVDFSGTAGPGGNNQITAGSIEGAGNYYLGSNQLAVGSNNLNTTVTGIISDCGATGNQCFNNFSSTSGGSIVKLGTGTLTLSGTNAYTGATTVNAGLLDVEGSTATSSLTTVNANAALAGTGTVGNTALASGGVFMPGNGAAGSAITVRGNLAFQSGAFYLVQINATTASLANVTGTATLGGATVNASFAAGTYVAKQYNILNAAGGVSGTFAGPVNTNLPANFHTSLSYDANNAYLKLLLNFIPPPSGGLNQNQHNVAHAIVGFFNSNGTIPVVFGGLTPAGLTQASGEVATGSQRTTFDAMGVFMGLLTDPFIDGRGDPVSAGASTGTSAYAAQDKPRSGAARDAYTAIYRKAPVTTDPLTQRWSVWAAGYGGSQTTDGNATLGPNSTTSRIYGTAVGAAYRLSPYTLAGFGLAGGGTNFAVANNLGSGRSDLFQAGAFIRHNAGAAYISGALAYAWQDITTNRTVTVASIDQLRAQFNANAWSGRVEGGYRFVSPWMGGIGITPYAAGQFITFDLPAYAEQAVVGSNAFALAFGSKSVTATRSELGIRTDKSWAMPESILTLRGRFAWAHDFNPDRSVSATFQTLPGASFVVNGAAQASDSALTTVSIERKWLNGFSLAAIFEGEFSDVTRSYAGKGVVRYAW